MSVQSMEALINANKARMARAVLKRDIASGETTVADALTDVPEHCDKMPIAMLLAAQDRWGKKRASRLLSTVGLIESKAIGNLTDRQRRVLLLHLP